MLVTSSCKGPIESLFNFIESPAHYVNWNSLQCFITFPFSAVSNSAKDVIAKQLLSSFLNFYLLILSGLFWLYISVNRVVEFFSEAGEIQYIFAP